MRGALLLGLVVLAGLGCTPSSSSPSPRDEHASAVATTADYDALSSGPITIFEQACARCHGPAGLFYGEGFAGAAGHDLATIVREMMHGPGMLSPSAAEVAAMTAYHRALAAREPFICVVRVQRSEAGWSLAGEVTVGAELLIQCDDERRDIAVAADGQWSATDLPGATVVLRARRQGKTTTCRFPPQQWSHGPTPRL